MAIDRSTLNGLTYHNHRDAPPAQVHQIGYITDVDPVGTILSGQSWVTETGGIHRIRNADDDGYIVVGSSVAADAIPNADAVYDLGSGDYRWHELFIAQAYVVADGVAKNNVDSFHLVNAAHAADMDNTRTSILWRQFIEDASPVAVDAARITVGTEQDWTSTGASQDAYMAFATALNGTVTEHARITSAGFLGIHETTPAGYLQITAATTSSIGVVLKTSDDNTGNPLLKTISSAGATTFSVSATGVVTSNAVTVTSTSAPQLSVRYDASNYWTWSVGNTGTLSLAGTGTSTGGALSITPVADRSITFSLSGTGDFIVNTSQFAVDTSSGFVIIGDVPANALSQLHVLKTHTHTSGSETLSRHVASANPASNSSGILVGGLFEARVTAANVRNFTNSIGALRGINTSANHEGTGTVTVALGHTALYRNLSTGIITTGMGMRVFTPVNSGGGTVVTGEGLNIQNQGLSGMTTAYGLYIEAQANATNNYAIVTESASVVFNETGASDGDVRMESDSYTNAFELDASDNAIYLMGNSGGKIGVFGATPIVRTSAYTQTYATTGRTLNAYTSDTESVAYTGIDNLQVGTVYAQLTDLNALRVAYETLRDSHDNLINVVNAMITDQKAYGWFQ